MSKKLAIIVGSLCLAGTGATPVFASEMIHFATVTNTDVATFGLGYLRGVGTGTLAVSGLSGTVNSAYLYWAGPTNSTDPNANANVSFGGSAVTGTNIGFSQDNFWGYANSQAYRADVSSIVQSIGNGNYALADFLGVNADINGLSLIVFYDDGVSANNKDVVLFNGNDANFSNNYDADNWNATLNGVNYSGGSAELVLHVSDGQNFSSQDDGELTFNGTVIADGGTFQGDGVQFGDGNFPSNGALWDVESFDITSLVATNNTLTLPGKNDALALIVAQFNLPVGSAPPPPAVPEPASWLMMIGGFALLGTMMRRKTATVRFVRATA